jgi:two-component system sensor kinase
VAIVSDHPESEQAARNLVEFLGTSADSQASLGDGESRPVLIADLSINSRDMLDQLTRQIFDGQHNPEDIICLIPAGQSDVLTECESLEIEQILTKPVKPNELLRAIQLVVDRNSLAEPIAASPFGGSRSSLYVLVADDSPVNREVASGMLELCGHRVRTVCDGKEAVEALQEEDFDLIFMDLEMPVMDGLAATRAIRQLPTEKSRVPIHAMTAHALSETNQSCRDAGMDGCITKPIVPEQLMELLNRVSAEAKNATSCLP